eukprot:3350122-Pleurochrysis_carterae.AAC.1
MHVSPCFRRLQVESLKAELAASRSAAAATAKADPKATSDEKEASVELATEEEASSQDGEQAGLDELDAFLSLCPCSTACLPSPRFVSAAFPRLA